MKKIEALIRPFKLEEVRQALTGAGVDALTVSEVLGRWRNESRTDTYRGLPYAIDLTPKIRLEVVVPDCRADQVVSLITGAARTSGSEAGIIVVFPGGGRRPYPHRGARRSRRLVTRRGR